MPGIDGLLKIVLQEDATHLNLETGEKPAMTRNGDPCTLTLPPFNEPTLRGLLGELLTIERAEQLDSGRRVELEHEVDGQVFLIQMENKNGLRIMSSRNLDSSPPAAPPSPSAEASATAAQPDTTPSESTPTSPPLSVPPTTTPRAPLPSAHTPLQSISARKEMLADQTTELGNELRRLLLKAVNLKASDLHISEGEVPVVRIDGQLLPLPSEHPADAATLFSESLGPKRLARLAGGVSVDMILEIPNGGRFRSNFFSDGQRTCRCLSSAQQ